MHARMHARVHTPARMRAHTPPSPYRYSMGLCQPTVTARSAGDNSWSLAIEMNTGTGVPVSPRFRVFFAYKKIARPNWDANSWEGVPGHHAWKSQASDKSLAKNDDLEPRERFVLWGKNIRQGAPL